MIKTLKKFVTSVLRESEMTDQERQAQIDQFISDKKAGRTVGSGGVADDLKRLRTQQLLMWVIPFERVEREGRTFRTDMKGKRTRLTFNFGKIIGLENAHKTQQSEDLSMQSLLKRSRALDLQPTQDGSKIVLRGPDFTKQATSFAEWDKILRELESPKVNAIFQFHDASTWVMKSAPTKDKPGVAFHCAHAFHKIREAGKAPPKRFPILVPNTQINNPSLKAAIKAGIAKPVTLDRESKTFVPGHDLKVKELEQAARQGKESFKDLIAKETKKKQDETELAALMADQSADLEADLGGYDSAELDDIHRYGDSNVAYDDEYKAGGDFEDAFEDEFKDRMGF